MYWVGDVQPTLMQVTKAVEQRTPDPSPVKAIHQGPYIPNMALRELVAWLKPRLEQKVYLKLDELAIGICLTAEGCFVERLASMWGVRVCKSPQVFVKAEPDSGKTTFCETFVRARRCSGEVLRLGLEATQAFNMVNFNQADGCVCGGWCLKRWIPLHKKMQTAAPLPRQNK